MYVCTLIDTVGNVELYTKRLLQSVDIIGIFWWDKYCITDHGPFPSVYDAMKHHVLILQERKATTRAPVQDFSDPYKLKVVENKIPGDLIQVDFKNKKRVI